MIRKIACVNMCHGEKEPYMRKGTYVTEKSQKWECRTRNGE